MVRGLEIFADFFAGDEAHYALIGGVATQLVLEDAGLPARATKDLDIVLCVESLDAAFGAKLWSFIRKGNYEVRQEGDLPRRFYRFAHPGDPRYPHMLEFFAREPGHLVLAEGAHLTPVPIDEAVASLSAILPVQQNGRQAVASLSAILLDRHYYDFLQSHTRQLAGVRVVTEEGLIPLKARAWSDLVARKAAGSLAADGRHISKHRNDVLRLSQLLSEGVPIQSPEAIAADVARFVDAMRDELHQELLRSLDILEPPERLLARLRAAYGLP